MKNLKLRLMMLVIGTVLTLGLSQQVAYAVGCADIIAGGNYNGTYDCRFRNECGGYCIYNCTCPTVNPWATCDDVLDVAGFEDIDPGDPCYD